MRGQPLHSDNHNDKYINKTKIITEIISEIFFNHLQSERRVDSVCCGNLMMIVVDFNHFLPEKLSYFLNLK